MKYKVLKEFLTVKNPRWLNPGEVIDGQPSGARIKALLEKEYIEEIPEHPKTIWDLNEDNQFFVISTRGDIDHYSWNAEPFDLEVREVGNIFLTKEEAEKELARRKAKVILRRDTKGFKLKPFEDWYMVYYNYTYREFIVVERQGTNNYGALTFATKADAEVSIKAHEKEWKTYLGVEERHD